MKYTQFRNELMEGKEFSVYLFEGEDTYFRERGMNLLKEKFVQEPALNLVFLANDCTPTQLTSSLEGYPFMSPKRMAVLREFYPKQDFFKGGLKDYLQNPSTYSVLAILNEKPCELLKKFDSVCVVDCSKQDVSLIVKWIKAECSNANVHIEGQTAQMLAEYCLLDMTRIQTETNKLISYSGDGGIISREDVDLMVAKDNEYKIYEMTDCIGKRKFDKALLIIKDMLSKGEPPQRVLLSIYNYFRRLLHVAISDMDVQEMAKVFGIKDFAVRKAKEQAQMFKKKALKNAVDELSNADNKIKNGLIDAFDAMYLTVFKIMTDK